MSFPASFHPIICSWFTETYGKPTAVQEEAWPLIEQGKHVLALAPTGSGKTLTAFLSAISRFCPAADGRASSYPPDKLSVLYVSPLKALNEDIKRNLLEPLDALGSRFTGAGLDFPAIRVETRSGDTPPSARRRFLVQPPSILALTPESLNILLLNPAGRKVLSSVKYLIIDEIHAVLGNKRGAFLSCQIERLAQNSGEFQRISLSATIRSPQIAAEVMGGHGRAVSIVNPKTDKQIELDIQYSNTPFISRSTALAAVSDKETSTEQRQIAEYGRPYSAIINYVLGRIRERSIILVFTNSRRRSERLCYFINKEHQILYSHNEEPVAFTHHGSLSLELRRAVEKRLAEGRLPCVVATSSLELGIDIGSIDEVVLAGSPSTVSQALQRIGRAGHGVGKISRARIFPFHGLELLTAAALKNAVEERDIEEIHPIENPLDILAQLILSLIAEKKFTVDELYEQVKTFYLFRNLDPALYMQTLRMLSGWGEKTRLRELKPRIWIDSDNRETGPLAGLLPLLYTSGGVITSRGLYSLRLSDGTKMGELDEEFVWERRLGDCFDFGAQGWRITSISAEAVEVVPLNSVAHTVPFWKADTMFRSSNLSNRILSILDNADDPGISAELRLFLDSQRSSQGSKVLPGKNNITVEITGTIENTKDYINIVIHTFRGGAINYPLSLALAKDMEEVLALRVESFANDDSILLFIPRINFGRTSSPQTPHADAAEHLLRKSLITLNNTGDGGIIRGERLFRNRLETTGIFGSAFREAAERSLVLPRAAFGKRIPLWITRQRSKRLFDAAAQEDCFPITVEAWRTCLNDIFDMEGFRNLLSEIQNGTITLSFFHTSQPSPFAQDLVRQETNALLYEYDERKDLSHIGYGLSRATLSDRVIEEALGNSALRPALKPELIADFVSRLRREIPAWAPEDELSLSEWIKERIAIPLDEWKILRTALPEKLRAATGCQNVGEICISRVCVIKREGSGLASLVHKEWEKTWKDEALSLLGLWLRYQGPVSMERIATVFGVSLTEAEDAVDALSELDEIVRKVAILPDPHIFQRQEGQGEDPDSIPKIDTDADLWLCDKENLELLLRLSRRKARPLVKEKPPAFIAPLLALRQGLIADVDTQRDTSFFNRLSGFLAPAQLWETEILPARSSNYTKEFIDGKMRNGEIIWYGEHKERIGFCTPEDCELNLPRKEEQNKNSSRTIEYLSQIIKQGFFDKARDYWEIKEHLQKLAPDLNSGDCISSLWQLVWQGKLSSDTFEPVRRGIEDGFENDSRIKRETDNFRSVIQSGPFTPGRMPRVPRALRDRWKSGAPLAGKWFSLGIEETVDLLDEETLKRERIRLLLSRYGILARPLLEHEAFCFSWSELLPCIRRMELAGELITGRFFSGINSLQFTTPAMLPEIERAHKITGLYWMNAADPASLAGREIEGLSENMPRRSSHNRLYYRGTELIAVSQRSGKELGIYIETTDKDAAELISLFTIPRIRNVLPEKKLIIEKINNKDAAACAFTPLLKKAGFVADRGKLYLWERGGTNGEDFINIR